MPGVIQLAEQKKSFIGGDDLKSGQTKLKSVLAEFLVNAGIKPLSIASYNHLGNNDGHNLSAEPQFKSKEISKSSVVDDMVASNALLYKPADPNAPVAKNGRAAKCEHYADLLIDHNHLQYELTGRLRREVVQIHPFRALAKLVEKSKV